MQTSASTMTVAGAVGSATKTMSSMQQVVNPHKINNTMKQFAKVHGQLESHLLDVGV
jgi:hypothetical protein